MSPPTWTPANPPPLLGADTDPHRDGSLQHLLGVTPEELRGALCLPRAVAQRSHAGVAREVEARLVALADQMTAVVLGNDASGARWSNQNRRCWDAARVRFAGAGGLAMPAGVCLAAALGRGANARPLDP